MPENKDIREQIEPGVMGETDPAEQKILENLAHVAAGYYLAKTGGNVGEFLINKIGSKLTATKSALEGGDILQMAGLTPDEMGAIKNIPPSQRDTIFARSLRGEWSDLADKTIQSETRDVGSLVQKAHYIEPSYMQPPEPGFPLSQQNRSTLQSFRDRYLNAK